MVDDGVVVPETAGEWDLLPCPQGPCGRRIGSVTEPSTSRIVVGVDGSEGARLALDWAYEEARRRGATLEVVHVWAYPYYGALTPSVYLDAREIESAAQALLDRLIAPYADRGLVEVRGHLLDGPPAATLCAVAEGADLLVVGSRGRGGFKGLLLGSVGQQVAHHARCPIAIVPPRPHADQQAA